MKINKKIEGGKKTIDDFVRSLIDRNNVPDEKRESEEKRLNDVVMERIFREIVWALPDENLDDLEKATEESEEFPLEKWCAALFMAGVRPESIMDKVFREVEREYLGAENVETEETLIEEAEEEK